MKKLFVQGKTESSIISEIKIIFNGRTHKSVEELALQQEEEGLDFEKIDQKNDFHKFLTEMKVLDSHSSGNGATQASLFREFEKEYGEGFKIASQMEGFDVLKGFGKENQGIREPENLQENILSSKGVSNMYTKDIFHSLSICCDIDSLTNVLSEQVNSTSKSAYVFFLTKIKEDFLFLIQKSTQLRTDLHHTQSSIKEHVFKSKESQLRFKNAQEKHLAVQRTISCFEKDSLWSLIKEYFLTERPFVSKEIIVYFYSLLRKEILELSTSSEMFWERMQKYISRIAFIEETFIYLLGKRGKNFLIFDEDIDPLILKELAEYMTIGVLAPLLKDFFNLELSSCSDLEKGMGLIDKIRKGETHFERFLLENLLEKLCRSEEKGFRLMESNPTEYFQKQSVLLRSKTAKKIFRSKLVAQMTLSLRRKSLSHKALIAFSVNTLDFLSSKSAAFFTGFYLLPFLHCWTAQIDTQKEADLSEFLSFAAYLRTKVGAKFINQIFESSINFSAKQLKIFLVSVKKKLNVEEQKHFEEWITDLYTNKNDDG